MASEDGLQLLDKCSFGQPHSEKNGYHDPAYSLLTLRTLYDHDNVSRIVLLRCLLRLMMILHVEASAVAACIVQQ